MSSLQRIYLFALLGTLLLFSLHIQPAHSGGSVNNDELYKLLGVSKTATTKQIRQAFKKIALEKHPDKNKEDPNANENFIRINRAYEILKDDDLRKKYDLFGEEGLKEDHQRGQQYQSWNFYQQNFGIYDDDPEVITLSRSDFIQSVESTAQDSSDFSSTIWFVNFYSTQCSHCHELAPVWRQLAKQLDGVVRIGAVNCMDDWLLCNQEQIQAFPSLFIYPQRRQFTEPKTLDNLIKFAFSYAKGNVHDLTNKEAVDNQLRKYPQAAWLLSFCFERSARDEELDEDAFNYELNCLDKVVQRKLAIMLHGLVRFGSVRCQVGDELCSRLRAKRNHPLVFYEQLPSSSAESETTNEQTHAIDVESASDHKRIATLVLGLLPQVERIDAAEFKNVLDKLRNKESKENPWLIQFVNADYKSQSDVEMKKLKPLLGAKFNFAQFDCTNEAHLCTNVYQLTKYPSFVLFKSAAWQSDTTSEENMYEVYYSSRQTPEDLAAFVKENAFSSCRTLTNFNMDILSQILAKENKKAIIVDFFAPWCPPCMNLLPEFRKASKLDQAKHVTFATIDCSANQHICEQFQVRSYPTTIMFNQSQAHNYHGQHMAADINDFVEDILKPTVVTFDYNSFYQVVAKKPQGKVWLIDFYASWCGPCQQLAPEWRKLAKKLAATHKFDVVQVGQVDCQQQQALCAEQHVQSFPNIRVYPSDTNGLERYEIYQGWMRDLNSLFQWSQEYLPSKVANLNQNNFEKLVLRADKQNQPWVIDFYAPWCGHCQVLAPTFEQLAERLDGQVKFGKVNCQLNQYLCQMAAIQAFPTLRFYSHAHRSSQYNIGDELPLNYDLNFLINQLNTKLKQYGYDKKSKLQDNKTEL